MQLRILCCSFCASMALAGWCGGAEPELESADEPTIYVGLGGIVTSKPYVGVDAKVYPLPVFAYEGERLYFRGVTGGYRLISEGGWGIGPVIQPRFDGYDEDDSDALDGMADRKLSLDGGVGLSLLTKVGLFGLSYVTDLLGLHDGQELDFSYTIMFPAGGFDVIPSAGFVWWSENLVDYYYGVEADEATPDRLSYEGDHAVNPYVRVAVRRELSERWSVLAAVKYEWLADEVTESPIVDDDYDTSVMIGLLYAW